MSEEMANENRKRREMTTDKEISQRIVKVLSDTENPGPIYIDVRKISVLEKENSASSTYCVVEGKTVCFRTEDFELIKEALIGQFY